ncbi:MAG: biopolymer transporter ExbD [Planctomycetes bacterium]|nr:biopolymer transporter ExbD [Planctomycetota bacterium]
MPAMEHETIKMDMTPMIDVVFQLIIFFMLVTDMSQQDLAELKLPYAQKAAKDELMKGRLTFNLLKDGEIEIKRDRKGTMDDPGTQNWVRGFLQREVAKKPLEPDGTSDRPILIRADRETEFKHVQKILRVCGENGIRIYKIHLAAAQNERP